MKKKIKRLRLIFFLQITRFLLLDKIGKAQPTERDLDQLQEYVGGVISTILSLNILDENFKTNDHHGFNSKILSQFLEALKSEHHLDKNEKERNLAVAEKWAPLARPFYRKAANFLLYIGIPVAIVGFGMTMSLWVVALLLIMAFITLICIHLLEKQKWYMFLWRIELIIMALLFFLAIIFG
ncbi:hypothetical protein ACUL41_18975 [Virgibacillus natechei]|uniref:hypothetical protein n=1 Tax=Virgibacillus sp. CBA3643 TaxID=2942278 RepID=UPI0035A37136